MNADDIVILFGGDSGERRVSVASAQHIAAVLADARPWFVTPAGAVHECPREWLARHDRPFERDLEVPGAPAHPTLDGIFASSEPSSVGASLAIKSRGLGGKVKFVAFDSSELRS